MSVIVEIEQGKLSGKSVVGWSGRSYYSFHAIPYAKPPLGELRFKAPRPPEKWSGIRDATEEGPECFSRHMIYQNHVGSEDCLTLNVFTSELPSAKSHPKAVMVWIHGGAYVAGSSKTEIYGPDFLVDEDCVVVTVNYRLGILGFLSFDDTSLGVPGNAAHKDKVMALKWVQQNISKFNGDPNNVTIFGESAGGASIHYLMLSPMAKGLFHKAIAQSGCCLMPWSVARSPVFLLGEILGVPDKNEKELLEYMQNLPVEKILEAQEQIPDDYKAHVQRAIGPVIEKPCELEPNFITEHPLEIIRKGTYNHVPMIIGFTSMEGFFYAIVEKKKEKSLLIKDFLHAIPNHFDIDLTTPTAQILANRIKEYYYGNEEPTEENKEKFFLMQSDIFFIHGIYRTINEHRKTTKQPIYLYRFSVEGELNIYKALGEITIPGASHADDLGYLFKMFLTPDELDPKSIENKTIRRMVKMWTNFAKTGNPNSLDKSLGMNLNKWKPVDANTHHFLDIAEELHSGRNPEAERMLFWDDIMNSCGNAKAKL